MLINDIKEDASKRSDFLVQLESMIKEKNLRYKTYLRVIGKDKDFIEENKTVSPMK